MIEHHSQLFEVEIFVLLLFLEEVWNYALCDSPNKSLNHQRHKISMRLWYAGKWALAVIFFVWRRKETCLSLVRRVLVLSSERDVQVEYRELLSLS